MPIVHCANISPSLPCIICQEEFAKKVNNYFHYRSGHQLLARRSVIHGRKAKNSSFYNKLFCMKSAKIIAQVEVRMGRTVFFKKLYGYHRVVYWVSAIYYSTMSGIVTKQVKIFPGAEVLVA